MWMNVYSLFMYCMSGGQGVRGSGGQEVRGAVDLPWIFSNTYIHVQYIYPEAQEGHLLPPKSLQAI